VGGWAVARRCAAVALAIAAGIVAWQLAVRGWVEGERLRPAALWAPALVELAWAFGLAAVAAAIVLVSRPRSGRFGGAALVTLVFGILLALRIELTAWFAAAAADASRAAFLCASGAASGGGPAATWRDALRLQPIVLPLALVGLSWRQLLHRVRVLSPRTAVACAGALAFVAWQDHLAQAAARAARALEVGPCAAGATRTFRVSAIPVELTLNRFGDHDPFGYMYALDERLSEVRAADAADHVAVGLHDDPVQPLVLRANAGECLEIQFTNRLRDEPAALHLHGLPLHRGPDPDRLATPGETLAYRFAIPDGPDAEGAYYLHDHGAGDRRIAHGLFGAVVVEPAGSRHLHPATGAPLAQNGWEAIIEPPDAPPFREFVLFFHTLGDGLRDARERELREVYARAELYLPAARAINYRSEPRRDMLLLAGGRHAPWTGYDSAKAATPALRSYVGERTKMRVLHGGTDVSHAVVFHPHGGQMLPTRGDSTGHGAVIAPGVPLDLDLDCSGKFGCLPAAGDYLFRCDVPNHALGGMWATWRVYATLQPDVAVLPGTPVPPERAEFEGLVGRVAHGKGLVPRGSLVDPDAERALEDWFRMMPPAR